MTEIQTICVFCGSGMGYGDQYRIAADTMGEALAKRGLQLVYGGSNIGTMRVLADAALRNGGKVIGIMPHLLADKEILHTGVSEVITVDSMQERKELMGQMSDAFITLPGGFGTLDELFEALSWVQLKIMDKPVAILNVDGYYDTLLAFLDHSAKEGFLRPEHRQNIIVDTDANKLIDKILSFVPVQVDSKWVANLIKDTHEKHVLPKF
jgi:uncharacterized protein (TIGR00730 family)